MSGPAPTSTDPNRLRSPSAEGLDPLLQPHWDRSALLTIDVQRDFLDHGTAPIPGTTTVLPAIAKVLDAYRAAGRLVVHVVRLYAGDDVDLVRRTAITAGAPVVRPHSDGSQLAPGIRPPGAAELEADRLLGGQIQQLGPCEVVVWKPRWSAFYRTPLHRLLSSLDLDTLVLAGCNYPNCPRATLYDATERDYRTVLATDAISRLAPLHLEEAAEIGALSAPVQLIGQAVSEAPHPSRRAPAVPGRPRPTDPASGLTLT